MPRGCHGVISSAADGSRSKKPAAGEEQRVGCWCCAGTVVHMGTKLLGMFALKSADGCEWVCTVIDRRKLCSISVKNSEGPLVEVSMSAAKIMAG